MPRDVMNAVALDQIDYHERCAQAVTSETLQGANEPVCKRCRVMIAPSAAVHRLKVTASSTASSQ